MTSTFEDSAHNACRFVVVGRLGGFLLHTSAFGRSYVWEFSQEGGFPDFSWGTC
jgi:hypothetical protein